MNGRPCVLAEDRNGRKYGAAFGLAAFFKKFSGALLGMFLAAWWVEHCGFTASLGTFGVSLALSSAVPAVFSRHLRLRFKDDAAALYAAAS